jgi:hypothetical protein
MATWEDGPEYAPVARPDHFAEADTAPLVLEVPPPPSYPSAPAQRPAFDQPQQPVAALETLVPAVEEDRDPSVPFDVAATNLTEATSAWSAAHWSRPGEPAGASLPPPVDYGVQPWPGAAPSPPPSYPPPSQPPPSYPPPQPGPAPFPAPGTAQWFAPPPAPPPTLAPASVDVSAIARSLTPGLIICLVIGGIVWPLAPMTFAVAFALTLQMKAGRSLTQILFAVATGLLVFVVGFDILLGAGLFGDWWELLSRWAQALSWIMLVISWIVVYRDLHSGAAPPPRNPWG